ncbi:hypothetical protein V8E51_002477 [Hyaloscypha variabilis]
MATIPIFWVELLECIVAGREAKALQQGLRSVYNLSRGGNLALGMATAITLTGQALDDSLVNGPLVETNLQKIQAGLLGSFTTGKGSPTDFDNLKNLSSLMGEPTLGAIPKTLQDLTKASAQQLVKGGLIQLALTAEEEYMAKHIVSSPITIRGVNQITAIVKNLKGQMSAMNTITTSWRQWLVDHYAKRVKYGMVTANSVALYRYEILQQKLAALSTMVDHDLASSFSAAHKHSSVAKFWELKEELIRYAAQVHQISLGIRDKESLMVRDGLKTNEAEVQGVLSALNANLFLNGTRLSDGELNNAMRKRVAGLAERGLVKNAMQITGSEAEIRKEFASWLERENDDDKYPPPTGGSLGKWGHYTPHVRWALLQDAVVDLMDRLVHIGERLGRAVTDQDKAIRDTLQEQIQRNASGVNIPGLQAQINQAETAFRTIREEAQDLHDIAEEGLEFGTATYVLVQIASTAIRLRLMVDAAQQATGTHTMTHDLVATLEEARRVATDADELVEELANNRFYYYDDTMSKAPEE